MPNDLTIRLGQDLDLVPGQSALLESLSIRATLAEAHGPRAGCFDCPNNATLQVFQGPESQALQYSFSGGMLGELLQQAKRKNAFGYTFVAVRIIEGGLTLRVEPATS